MIYYDDCLDYFKQQCSTVDPGSMQLKLEFIRFEFLLSISHLLFFSFEEKYVKDKQQLVQDVIPPPSGMQQAVTSQSSSLLPYQGFFLSGFSAARVRNRDQIQIRSLEPGLICMLTNYFNQTNTYFQYKLKHLFSFQAFRERRTSKPLIDVAFITS